MIASAITSTSSPTSTALIIQKPPCMASENAAFEMRINKRICGMMSGKPRIAIIAAFCFARAAIADKKVNTRLRLMPPRQTTAKKFEWVLQRIAHQQTE